MTSFGQFGLRKLVIEFQGLSLKVMQGVVGDSKGRRRMTILISNAVVSNRAAVYKLD